METYEDGTNHRRRLNRAKALKNVDYEPFRSAPGSPANKISFISFDEVPVSNSLGSFRIHGGDAKEELDKICSVLGISGPEALGISSDEWNTRKWRKQAMENGSRSRKSGRVSFSLHDSVVGSSNSEDTVLRPPRLHNSPMGSRTLSRSEAFGSRSIAPPPGMSVKSRVFDERTASVWDLVKSLAPDEDDNDIPAIQSLDSSSEEEEHEEEGEEEDEEGEVGRSVVGVERKTEDCASTCTSTSTSGYAEEASPQSSTEDNSSMLYYISSEAKFKIPIRFWCKGHLLGSGSFGQVYEAISDTGSFFAVKEVSLLDQGHNARQCITQLQHEIALLSDFEHENIVQYFGTDKEPQKLYIFLELVPQGSLAALYRKYALGESQVRAYTKQILTGLKYLHDRRIVHRDIKCANILVDNRGLIKLADFGLAKETSKLNDLKSCKGSAFWMAPEVIIPRKTYSFPADIWSLGCTVLEMLCRRPPNSDLEWQRVLWKVGHGEPPVIPNSLSKDAKEFITQCLRIEPEERPSAADLLSHAFVRRSFSEDLSSFRPVHISHNKTQ